ncbi:hypothetical protein [Streptomyces xantholiticus]|uniref:hypothetical protein n=1 Tax=Streptomyces xantholiticus TaxID=68285 RepID=UPI00167B23A6|nr:hypothetical protein [Streptomyces xantholiticus]GGW57266.1 hypothetical protein GCM10010381_48140 [Streptomyces xantholiticus]
MGRADLASLVRICDPAGRPYGTGFVADDIGTVVTGHDVVRGLIRPVLVPLDGSGPAVEADAVTPLPDSALALVHARGLRLPPLPLGARERVEPGTYVRLPAGGWREARVLAAGHGVLELAIGTDGSDALRLAGTAAGGPVLDAATGAVLAVLAAAPPPGAPAADLARPLGTARSEPHAALLRRNAAIAPAYGQDLNLAAVLALTAITLGRAGALDEDRPQPVRRPEMAREFGAFTGQSGTGRVLGLVGAPGTGRTTELRALADRRAQGPQPAPTLWLRGADLRAGDASLAVAVARTLRGAARILAVPERGVGPDQVARLAAEAGRPLLVVLDGLEEMAPEAAGALPEWTAATVEWLVSSGVRLVVSCRPEYWAEAGVLYPPGVLHRPAGGGPAPVPPRVAQGGTPLQPATPSGVLAASEASGSRPGAGTGPEAQDRFPVPWEPARVSSPPGGCAGTGGRPAGAFAVAVAAGAARGEQSGGVPAWDTDPGPATVAMPAGAAAKASARTAVLKPPAGVPGARPSGTPAGVQLAPQRCGRPSALPAEGSSAPAPRPTAAVGLPPARPHEGPGSPAQVMPGGSDASRSRTAGDPAGVPRSRTYRDHCPEPAPGSPDPGRDPYVAPDPGTPPALRLGDLTPEQARLARERYGLEDGAVAAVDERHPLVLRLLAQLRRAVPGAAAGRPGREDVFGAYLDLVCLRVAVRITARSGTQPRGSAVRRLAATVADRTHEAARRCLGPGHGQLDHAAFEELFPCADGWASAVLAEGLLVPAGEGYRFAHEELADWIQGAHLDLDVALRSLLHHRPGEDGPAVPRHRIGPVVHGLLLLGRERGAGLLASKLWELVDALDDRCTPDARWWASALLREVLVRVPDAEPFLAVLHRLVERPGGEFGPRFWARPALGDPSRFDLLRRLVPSDPPPSADALVPRHLELADERLTADPGAVQPLLCRWFDDDTPLAAGLDTAVRPTVGAAAQALLYARRGLAPDDLTEALVDAAHPRAAELLHALTEDEPSAMCRAVDRWARDPRPERRAAAAAYAALLAPTEAADRDLLRRAARALLAGTRDAYGPALTVLVRDPVSRARHLERALDLVAAGDPRLPVAALTDAVATDPGPVLTAFRTRLLRPGTTADAEEILATLAEAATTAATARRVAALVCEYVDHRPDGAAHAAAYVHHRLEHGPDGGDVLFPLVTHLVRGRPAGVRSALAPVLAAPGSPASRPLRAELLEELLRYEQYAARDVAVLDALLHAAAHGCGVREEAWTRALVHRTGLLLVRTPKGAVCFDRRLTELSREVPAFASLMSRWPAADPQEWAVVEACRALGTGDGQVPMPTGSVGHGSLRPA